MAAEIVLVKLGGSLITDKEEREWPRLEVIERLAGELAEARAGGAANGVVLAHGSGSYGHFAARGTALVDERSADDGVSAGLRDAAAATQDAAARLHRLVIAALVRCGVPAYSVAPSSCSSFDRQGRVIGSWPAVVGALHRAMVPVLYGDVLLHAARGFAIASTERLLEHLAGDLLRAGLTIREALWLGCTDGLLGSDGATVARIDEETLRPARAAATASAGVDVTGGMSLRLDATWRLAQMGVVSRILDGQRAGALRSALAGRYEGGTVVCARGCDAREPRP